MRTTFTPAPAIGDRLRQYAKARGQSLNEAVNELLRQALDEVTPRREPIELLTHPFSLRSEIPKEDLAAWEQELDDLERLERMRREETEEMVRRSRAA